MLRCERNTAHEWGRRGESRDGQRPESQLYVDFATKYRQAKAQGAEFFHDIVLEAAIGSRRAGARKGNA